MTENEVFDDERLSSGNQQPFGTIKPSYSSASPTLRRRTSDSLIPIPTAAKYVYNAQVISSPGTTLINFVLCGQPSGPINENPYSTTPDDMLEQPQLQSFRSQFIRQLDVLRKQRYEELMTNQACSKSKSKFDGTVWQIKHFCPSSMY